MGLFDSIFGNPQGQDANKKSSDTQQLPWTILNRSEQLDELVENSQSTPVAIFKHSTSCGISRMVLKQFESEYDIPSNTLQPVYLDLKAYRAVSNTIAQRFGIRHESPQLLLLKNGNVVYSDSHGAISVAALKAHL
ncbi:MAG: bacillithiol system redox-active protein YtxJ [Cytophagaceae bacterium]|nr:bacillithiol system redox-active protein YtxJ [Cytophagaceae bacterium]|tara:strand:+ start:1027 stop:1434 length:408 start_codon:yes stop_codon:yes gene_type:complete